MNVFKILTDEQAQAVEGQQYMPGAFFWWVLDGNQPANKVLSVVQVEQCTNPDFEWVKELPLIPWVAPAPPEPIETDATN